MRLKAHRKRKESIQKRIFMHFIPIMLGTIFAIIMVSIVVLMVSGFNSETRSLCNNVSMATKQISLLLEQIRDNSRAFATSSKLQSTMRNYYIENINPYRSFQNDIRTSIFSFVNIEPFTWEMTLVSTNGMTYLYPSGTVLPSNSYMNTSWYKTAVARNGRVDMRMEKEGYWTKEELLPFLILEKSIIHTETGVLLGAMRIKVRENLFSETFPAIQSMVGGEYIIVDSSGIIVTSQNKDELFSLLDGIDVLHSDGISQEARVCNIRDQMQLVAIRKTDIIDLYVIGMVPLSIILTKNTVLFYMMFIIGLLFLGIAIISVSMLTRRIVNPIHLLVNATQSVSDGDLSTEILVNSADEIGQLAGSFNKMLKDIRMLTHQIWLEQRRKREYALQFMQNQINPHLLYNSIMSITQMITSDQKFKASNALTHLGQYYKKVLTKNNMSVTVEDDVELSREYMILQQQIQSDLFIFEIHISPEVMCCPFLKLTLQPIIENSLLHGFMGFLQSGGLIIITGEVKDNMVEICIQDNGRGMSPEIIESIQNSSETDQHYGLRNISERIKLRFGVQYKLHIKSEPGKGTSVTVRIPAEGQM